MTADAATMTFACGRLATSIPWLYMALCSVWSRPQSGPGSRPDAVRLASGHRTRYMSCEHIVLYDMIDI